MMVLARAAAALWSMQPWPLIRGRAAGWRRALQRRFCDGSVDQALAAQFRAEAERLRKRILELEAEPPAARPAPPRLFVPPGHYYSPIPNPRDVASAGTDGPPQPPSSILGIDLNEAEQLDLIERLARFYSEQPFGDVPQAGLRYHFDNPYFGHGDAIVLYAMLRHLRSRRIVEVGSGYSSAVVLDTNDLFLDGRLACTFIDPYPERLISMMRPGDRGRVRIIPERLQAVGPSVSSDLEAGDILFIDSTHVSKFASDVNHYFFEMIPRLRSGVYVHIHDVFYPFEYPVEWLRENRAWNELYTLRAFLQYNDEFSIVLFNSFLGSLHRGRLQELMPDFLRNPGGSLWLRRR